MTSSAQGYGRRAFGVVAVLVISVLSAASPGAVRRTSRLAVIDLAGDEGGALAGALRGIALREGLNEPLELVDEQQVASAVRGSGYRGSLNLGLREARDLGMSIGCEYYVLGKVAVGRRIGPIGTEAGSGASYYLGVIGLFLVEARRGRLGAFSFQQVDGKSEDEARKRLLASLGDVWSRLKKGLVAKARLDASATPDDGVVIDLDDPSTPTRGLVPPVFYERLRPQYTSEAQLAEITAAVEIQAVFRGNGQVTDLEIVKWAGFGLDESALETAARLRFKPAERNGQPISVRALVRYNFKG
jgi:TonB family protein